MNLIINAGEAIGAEKPGIVEVRTGERELTASGNPREFYFRGAHAGQLRLAGNQGYGFGNG